MQYRTEESYHLKICITGEMGWYGWQIINMDTDTLVAEGSATCASPLSAARAALREYADRLGG